MGLLAAAPSTPSSSPPLKSQLQASSCFEPEEPSHLQVKPGAPASGQGEVGGAGCHFVISQGFKGRQAPGKGGRGARGSQGAVSPWPSLPRGPAHLVCSCCGRKEPGKSRGMEAVGKTTLPGPFAPLLPNSTCGLCAGMTV